MRWCLGQPLRCRPVVASPWQPLLLLPTIYIVISITGRVKTPGHLFRIPPCSYLGHPFWFYLILFALRPPPAALLNAAAGTLMRALAPAAAGSPV